MAMRRSTKMQLAKAAREGNMPGRKMEFEYERWGPDQRGGSGSNMEMGYGGEMRMESGGGGRSGGGRSSGARSNWDDDFDMEMRRGSGGARSDWDNDFGMEMRRGQRRDRMGRFTSEYGGYAPFGPYGEGGRARSEYGGAENRFRDRRGREHYDNGRFAPMSEMGGMENDDPFEMRQEGGDMMRQIGFNANWNGEMRMGSDASIPQFNEMERMPGNQAMMGGYMAERQHRKLDEHTAMEWVKSMKNADGSKSPHWTLDQVKQVSRQKGLNMDPVEVFAILNALYSDYDPIFKKHGVSHMDFYVDMAKAWLKDKDAVPNKAMAYYECIAK